MSYSHTMQATIITWATAIVGALDHVSMACASVEASLLSVFGLDASIPFRAFAQFPETTAKPTFPPFTPTEAAVHRLVCLATLLLVPLVVTWEEELERKKVNGVSPKGLVGRLVSPWTRDNRYVANAIMLVRVWLVLASMNAMVIHSMKTGVMKGRTLCLMACLSLLL